MNAGHKLQGGWTIWTLSGSLIMVGLAAILVMKMLPPYMDHYKLKAAMITVSKESGVQRETKRNVIRRMNKILNIDFADDVVNLADALRIEKRKQLVKWHLEYEVVVPLAYNVSLLLEFKESVEPN
jgi:hypothetical protein